MIIYKVLLMSILGNDVQNRIVPKNGHFIIFLDILYNWFYTMFIIFLGNRRWKTLKNNILDYEQVNEILDILKKNKKFIEVNDLGNTEFSLPIRHFIVGNGNNDIVITRSNSWKWNNYYRFYIKNNEWYK